VTDYSLREEAWTPFTKVKAPLRSFYANPIREADDAYGAKEPLDSLFAAPGNCTFAEVIINPTKAGDVIRFLMPGADLAFDAEALIVFPVFEAKQHFVHIIFHNILDVAMYGAVPC
jgi:hypothetical protein